jgi:uncharacterized membrane protein
MPWRAPAVLLCALSLLISCSVCSAQKPAPPAKNPPTAPPGPAAPQSTHFPILLLAFGNNPAWELRIGQKGPERLDRAGYPPIPLEPAEVAREGTSDAWTYNAKDLQTGATVAVHLTREPCSDNISPTKYPFHAVVQHAEIGTLNGCARIAAEVFPKISNQSEEDEDQAKKTPPVQTITKFKAPVAFAYINPAGKVVVARGTVRKIAAPAGTELSLSHDGKRLLYTRSDTTGPGSAIVLYEFDTGRSKELVTGSVRQAFWSTDDSRVAFLKNQDQRWQVWMFPAGAPEQAAPIYANNVNALHGWIDAHTLLASDLQNAYWIADDGKVLQTLPLRDLYGEAFRIRDSDTLRVNPANSDIILVSAAYGTPPPNAPTDAAGVAAGFFSYEVRFKRRVVLSPADQWARHGEWSRDGVQIFYTRRLSPAASTYRIFWDGSGMRRYIDGTDLVVGE